jgi:hypothetical protein
MEAFNLMRKLAAGRRIALHDNTSAVFGEAMPEDMQEQRGLHTMTNVLCMTNTGELRPVANANFDLKACHDAMTTAKQPISISHGSLLNYKAQRFVDLPAWYKIFKSKVADPQFYRRQITESMRLYTKWLTQVEAGLRDEYTTEKSSRFVSRMATRLQKLLKPKSRFRARLQKALSFKDKEKLSESQKRTLSEDHPWLVDTLKKETYLPEKVAQTMELRLGALETGMKNPLSNSLADYLRSVTDGPDAQGCHYLPARLDVAGIFSGKRGIDQIWLDWTNPNTQLLWNGDEDEFEAQFERDIDEDIRNTTVRAASGTKLYDIIDEDLAKELDIWYTLQQETIRSSLAYLADKRNSGQEESEDDRKIRSILENMDHDCKDGPVVTHVREMLASSSDSSDG